MNRPTSSAAACVLIVPTIRRRERAERSPFHPGRCKLDATFSIFESPTLMTVVFLAVVCSTPLVAQENKLPKNVRSTQKSTVLSNTTPKEHTHATPAAP